MVVDSYMFKAIIIGGTGATGKQLLNQAFQMKQLRWLQMLKYIMHH